MKNNRMWALSLVLLLAGFNTSCQRRDDSVQAAREEGYAPATADDKVLLPAEREIAMKIEQSNLDELDLARLAKDRASNGDVAEYAEVLIDDHADALQEIANILKEKHARDTSPQSKPAEAQAELAKLQTLSGAAFDREFIDAMLMDHRKTLDALRKAVTIVQNPDLRDYIKDLTKKVEKHLEKAQELESKLMTSKK